MMRTDLQALIGENRNILKQVKSLEQDKLRHEEQVNMMNQDIEESKQAMSKMNEDMEAIVKKYQEMLGEFEL